MNKDIFISRILGYSIHNRVMARWAAHALDMAVARRAAVAGARTSMGCFFALLQKYVPDLDRWATRGKSPLALVAWIEGPCHRRRTRLRLVRLPLWNMKQTENQLASQPDIRSVTTACRGTQLPHQACRRQEAQRGNHRSGPTSPEPPVRQAPRRSGLPGSCRSGSLNNGHEPTTSTRSSLPSVPPCGSRKQDSSTRRPDNPDRGKDGPVPSLATFAGCFHGLRPIRNSPASRSDEC